MSPIMDRNIYFLLRNLVVFLFMESGQCKRMPENELEIRHLPEKYRKTYAKAIGWNTTNFSTPFMNILFF